jgi:probable H4MPT-linked C1 transfer pathway protein
MAITAGYDVGGAHLKVALAEDGRVIDVRQIACPLWQGLDRLDAAVTEARPLIARAERHAVTMTGELCELFPDRRTGVRAILDHLKALLPAFQVWMGVRGLAAPDTAETDPLSVASTNYLATATLISQRLPHALLIDMGSTTTDIIAIVSGKPAPRGITDGERLMTSELVYTGLTRTDPCIVTRSGQLHGRKQRLANGGFANMADVRRILGELPGGLDQHATADGRGKSVEESVARFARVFGRDAEGAPIDEWRAAAREFADKQMTEIRLASNVVLAQADHVDGPVVVAGVGAPQLEVLMHYQRRETVRFGVLAGAMPECADWATYCAPAAALALLAQTVERG